MPPGKYEVTFRLKTENQVNPGHLADIDTATDLGERLFTQRQISTSDFTPNAWKEFTLNFQLNAATDNMEFRVIFYPGCADLYVDTIQLVKTDGWPTLDPRTPVFLPISVIAYARTPDAVEAFLTKIANLDPRIHLINTDEFFAALDPRFISELSEELTVHADPTLISLAARADLGKAHDLFTNGNFGDFLSVTRSIIRETTAALTVNAFPTDAGTISPEVGVYVYSLGTIVTANETEKEGYGFLGWTLEGKSNGTFGSMAVKMDSDHSLAATYYAKTLPVTTTSAITTESRRQLNTGSYPTQLPVSIIATVTASISANWRRRRKRGGKSATTENSRDMQA